jgi:hypothetical protein
MKYLLRWIHGSERPPVQHEGAEPFFGPESETWLQRIGRPLLAVLGLLCHLLIFWLLSFPYTYFEEGICHVDCISTTTGWQAMGSILILPVFPYLACFLPMLRKSVQKEQYLEMGLYLNVLVNLGGFLLISGALQLPFFAADLYNVAWHDAAYGIHLTLLLLAVVSSSVISVALRSWLRRSRKLR